MIPVYAIVEGKSEKNFVIQVLAPYLKASGIILKPVVVATSRKKGIRYEGGGSSYAKWQREIMFTIRQRDNENAYYTSMFDLYRLPKGFPGNNTEIRKKPASQKLNILEDCFQNDINHSRNRFIPYLQIYEFEALLFSDLDKFGYYESYRKNIKRLFKSVNKFNCPEDIDNSNPPKKRIMNIFPNYDNANHGPAILREIGMENIRKACPHFNEWITKLENLNK